ncbi:formyltetrahydrofolate deformylase [Tichowtungia aerotolerans]|uniref:Formyltetrahydrofolate deformylase n=1 Tax=Tichowtungia aerotolerans TaxID=2697043 RepID=A0A6P1MAE6_9BACT|nr:formyltetrahydrofolate deformylase [Tichowtungia aerotolerans]QHI70811.1 formyltetrahydrofolate deformylase [Tichowtungia aerotolerans]
MKDKASAILLISCPDQQGIVCAVTDFLMRHDGNIIDLEQHTDTEEGVFFMRVEWELEGFALPRDQISEKFSLIADRHQMKVELHFSDYRPRVAIFVSKFSHCIHDLLARRHTGEYNVDIPLIVSNHPDLEPLAKMYGVDYQLIEITKENKAEQEQKTIDLMREYSIDLIVLARYMQILSDNFCRQFPNRIINIHHSFLPAFVGAKPYHSAHQRGVKIIGATSHYVTSDLDEGPIIEQEVMRVSHKDSVESLIRKGRDLEKVVLSRAVWAHLQNRVLAYKNRTVVFS